MPSLKNCPTCGKEDCFGCQDGHCVVLIDNTFDKERPFYKTKEQVKEEQKYCRERLEQLTEE